MENRITASASPLAKLTRPNGHIDKPLTVVTLLLVVIGLMMLYSSSYAYSLTYYGDSYHYIKNQAVYAAAGLVMMFIVSNISYRLYYKWAWTLFVVSYVLLALTLIMPPVNGARRWIVIGSHTFQPSEIVKFAVIALFARIVADAPERMREFKYGFVQPMFILGLIALVTLNQTHLSGTIIILSIGVVLMFVGGTRIAYFLMVVGGALPALGAYVLMSDKMQYAMSRINTWVHPFEYSSKEGYQTVQSLLAIGSGGLFGMGLGNSRQKQLYIPEPQNDFIFSVVCEELGFIGAVLILCLFIIYVFRGFRIALLAKDKFSALVAIGISSQIGIQTVLNIGVVTNTIPNTGISLPFFSQGGTSLLILLVETGILLSISRYSSSTNIEARDMS